MSLSGPPWWLRSCLALVLAVAVVPALNLAGSWLAAALQLPPGGTGRLAWDLGWLAASGIAMVATATALATRHHAAHAGLAGLLLGLGLGWAVASVGGDFPVWFTALALLTLPLQVGLGWWLGAPRHR